MAARMKGHNQLLCLHVHWSQFLIMVILVFWEAWGEEKGEILFLPLFLKAVYSSCLIPLSPGRSHAFPWVPTTASCLPFVSAQCSTGRKPAEMGSTIKTHFNIFPTQLPGPVALSESFGFEPT